MKNTIFKGFFNRQEKNQTDLKKSNRNFGLCLYKNRLVSLKYWLIPTSAIFSTVASASLVGINEIHYDNTGSDIGEGIELVGQAGLSLENWSLYFYNGSDGDSYKNLSLDNSFAFENSDIGISFLRVEISGLQNGPADGVALVDDLGEVVSFLSYEGGLFATGGPAEGLFAEEIDAEQLGTTPVGLTLQRSGDISWNGSALTFLDAEWILGEASWEAINLDQQIFGSNTTPSPVPLPGALWLFATALGGSLILKRNNEGC